MAGLFPGLHAGLCSFNAHVPLRFNMSRNCGIVKKARSRNLVSRGRENKPPCGTHRSEVQRTWMTDHGRACLLWPRRADLAECRFHLVDHEIDHVEWTFRAERAETPQKGLAGERSIGPERDGPHHVDPPAHPAVHHQGHPTAPSPRTDPTHP